MPEPDHDRELERQVERGNLFAHTVLSEQAMRANENEAMVNGLVDLLIRHRVVKADELLTAVEAAKQEAAEKGQLATVGVAIRVDGGEAGEPGAAVNCEERLHICKAVCCRMRFALSAEEIESGPMKWDLGRPYYNRRGDDGYCHQNDGETHGEFNRSSQRLIERGCDGREATGSGSGWAAGDALAGPSAGGQVGASAAVLGGDCAWALQRGRCGGSGRVGSGRRPVVSGGWRDAVCHSRHAIGAVPVVR